MIDSKAKGARGELKVRDELRKLTGLNWERTPGSGMYSQSHGLKGDIYVPGTTNMYTIEIKNYEEDHLTSKIFNKSSKLMEWWEQAMRQADQNGNEPLLIFKYDRSKLFVAYKYQSNDYKYNNITVRIDDYVFNIALLDDWVLHENPKFTK